MAHLYIFQRHTGFGSVFETNPTAGTKVQANGLFITHKIGAVATRYPVYYYKLQEEDGWYQYCYRVEIETTTPQLKDIVDLTIEPGFLPAGITTGGFCLKTLTESGTSGPLGIYTPVLTTLTLSSTIQSSSDDLVIDFTPLRYNVTSALAKDISKGDVPLYPSKPLVGMAPDGTQCLIFN